MLCAVAWTTGSIIDRTISEDRRKPTSRLLNARMFMPGRSICGLAARVGKAGSISLDAQSLAAPRSPHRLTHHHCFGPCLRSIGGIVTDKVDEDAGIQKVRNRGHR